jgi:hypothetical protein
VGLSSLRIQTKAFSPPRWLAQSYCQQLSAFSSLTLTHLSPFSDNIRPVGKRCSSLRSVCKTAVAFLLFHPLCSQSPAPPPYDPVRPLSFEDSLNQPLSTFALAIRILQSLRPPCLILSALHDIPGQTPSSFLSGSATSHHSDSTAIQRWNLPNNTFQTSWRLPGSTNIAFVTSKALGPRGIEEDWRLLWLLKETRVAVVGSRTLERNSRTNWHCGLPQRPADAQSLDLFDTVPFDSGRCWFKAT